MGLWSTIQWRAPGLTHSNFVAPPTLNKTKFEESRYLDIFKIGTDRTDQGTTREICTYGLNG